MTINGLHVYRLVCVLVFFIGLSELKNLLAGVPRGELIADVLFILPISCPASLRGF